MRSLFQGNHGRWNIMVFEEEDWEEWEEDDEEEEDW